jgi:predicted dehydrogenase
VIERTRVAVVGVGHLGSRHARVYAESPNAELVGVADVDLAKARAVADAHGVRAAARVAELIPDIEAASVAVPTVSHREVTAELLDAGVHVLVEKPIAASLVEAREMVDRARTRSRVLAVGHTERHNPRSRRFSPELAIRGSSRSTASARSRPGASISTSSWT